MKVEAGAEHEGVNLLVDWWVVTVCHRDSISVRPYREDYRQASGGQKRRRQTGGGTNLRTAPCSQIVEYQSRAACRRTEGSEHAEGVKTITRMIPHPSRERCYCNHWNQ